MKKVNVHAWQRPAVSTFKKVFVQPGHEDEPLEIEIRRLDQADRHMVWDIGDELATAYVGDPANGVAPSMPSIMVGGRPVVMSKALCANIATLTYAQVGDNEEEKYTFEQFVAMMVTAEDAFLEILRWSNEVNRPKPKNGSPADTVTA